MKAMHIESGDTVRYRGHRYDIHGTCKVYVPTARIAVVVWPAGMKGWSVGKGSWKRIPGDHTVILEERRGYQ